MAGMFDGGGDSNMTVSITGDASGAAAASNQAAQSLTQLAVAAQEAVARANAALAQLGTGMQGAAGTTEEAMGGMSTAMVGMAGTAQESFLGQNGLAGSAAIANESVQRTLGSGPSGMMGFFNSMGQGLKTAANGFADFTGKAMEAINPLNLFHSSVLKMVEVMGAWRLVEGGIQQIGSFASGIFSLPIAMEKAQGSWQYMFNPERTAGQSMTQWQAQGLGIAQGISQWTQKESINLPYTRQDLISAITSLAPAGLSAQGIEKYLPLIGDIAAAQNPNLSLQQASYSVMGAMMGYSRMLRYDLHINPEQLTQYGYNSGNSATLLPALQAYAQARGITSYNAQGQDVGAAYNISHTTFWGEWSSLIDRIQNTQIMTGNKGPFGQLKGGLEWLNAWIDDHGGQIDKFATMLGETLAGGMKAVSNAAGGLFEGLKQSGVIQNISDAFAGFAKWMSDPSIQQNLKSLGDQIGKVAGADLKGYASVAGGVIKGAADFWQGLGPQGQQAIEWLAGVPGQAMQYGGPFIQMAGGTLGNLGGAFGSAVTGDWKGVTTHLGNAAHGMANWGVGLAQGVANWAGHGDIAKAMPTVFNTLWKQWATGGGWATQQASQIFGGLLHGIGQGASAVGSTASNVWGNLGAMWNYATGQGLQLSAPTATVPDTALPLHPLTDAQKQAKYAAWVALDRKQHGPGSQTETQEAEKMHRAVVASHEQMEKQAAAAAARMAQQVAAHVRQMKEQVLAHLDEMQQGSGKHATQLTQKVSGALDTLVGATATRLRLLRGETDSAFGQMANSAGQWGANLVNELAAGMLGKTPAAKQAAVQVARQLRANLGFGSPTEEGPGADADTWAPNFIRMFNSGLLQGLPQVMQTAAAIAAAMNPVTAGGVAGAASYAYNTAYGASNVNFHLYGLPPSAVHQVVTQAQKQQDDRGNRILRRPGNYGRIGWIGG